MWILMMCTVLSACIYPFQVVLRMDSYEVCMPAYLAVLGFWGAYAVIDVLLYAPSLWQQCVGALRAQRLQRQQHARQRQHLPLWLMLLQACDASAYKKIQALQPLQSREEAMVYSALLCSRDDAVSAQYVRDFLEAWMPQDAVVIATLLYERLGLSSRACRAVQQQFFRGKMPPWLQQWAGVTRPNVDVMAACCLPQTLPHASWRPFMKRMLVAHILRAHTVEAVRGILASMPQAWLQDTLLRWAIVERMYSMDKGHALACLGIVSAQDDVGALYAWLYAGDAAALWQWREVATRFRNCLGEYAADICIQQPALQYFDALVHWDSQPQAVGEMVVHQSQQWLRKALLHAAQLTLPTPSDLREVA